MGKYRVTVDTGGTFSDFVYLDEEKDEVSVAKLPSTPDDPSRAILHGVEVLLAKGIKPEDISYFCHGTTVGTNALLEGKGVRTGPACDEGFPRHLRGRRAMPPARLGHLRHFLRSTAASGAAEPHRRGRERIDRRGEVLLPLDEEALRTTLRELARPKHVKSIAVCLLFSFLHPQHEERVRAIVAEELPDCAVSLSSGVAAADSRVLSAVHDRDQCLSRSPFWRAISPIWERRLAAAGVVTPQKYIMQSNGGMSTFAASARRAVATVLSGPAGGVTAGVQTCRTLGMPNIITFDMGGTSCDVALIRGGQPLVSARGKIEGHDIAVPMMDINTVSAGGGTIAGVERPRRDRSRAAQCRRGAGPRLLRRVANGPPSRTAISRSAISPPTISSAAACGSMPNARVPRSQTKVADPLGMPVAQAAEGMIRIIDVKMEEAIKAISTMRGHDLRDFMLLAFGGAGPLHAGRIARDLGMAGVIVPLYPGVFSAIGLLMSDVKHDYVRSRMTELSELTSDAVEAMFAELTRDAWRTCTATAFPPTASGSIAPSTCATPAKATRSRCLATKSRCTPTASPVCAGASTTCTSGCSATWRRTNRSKSCLIGCAASDGCRRRRCRNSSRPARKLSDALREYRQVRFDGESLDCPVYQRERLDVGLALQGPAILDQFDCTTVICRGQTARVDECKNIIITDGAP